MSEWINCKIAKPPESYSVLLYIVKFHSDGKHIFDNDILVGFYGDEDYDKVGFYIENLEDFKFIEETNLLKVIAWTLLPRKPYKSIFKDEWSG